MNKKILASMMVIGLVATLTGAGLYALYSDTETSTDNVFTAGTLDLKVGGMDDPDVFAFNLKDMEPGTEGRHDFLVTNAGSIPGMLSITVEKIVNLPGTTPEPEVGCGDDKGELGDAIMVLLWVSDTVDDWYADSGTSNIYNGPLNGLVGYHAVGQGVLPEYVHFHWSIADTVGNEIMDDSVSFDIVFSLDQ